MYSSPIRVAAALLTAGGLVLTAAGCDPTETVGECGAGGSPPFRQGRSFVTPTPIPEVRTPGYLHTEGALIVDFVGRPVRLTGVSWFGFETKAYAPHGLHTRSLGSMLDQIRRLGYNLIRVPISTELMLSAGRTPPPGAIDYAHNPDLEGLDGLEVLDAFVQAARERDLRIIFDRHWGAASDDPEGPNDSCANDFWYDATYSEQRWIDSLQALAERYLGEPTVVGIDLHDEPGNRATWGTGPIATDWRLAAERGGNAVLDVNPELLIIVQGVVRVGDFAYWSGGNLMGASSDPVRLNVPDQLVYSTHDYPSTVAPQPWFYDTRYPENLPELWDSVWGYLVSDNFAPVMIGEFGSRLQDDLDWAWLYQLAGYIDRYRLSFAVWSWNPNSQATGGILEDDWRTVRQGFQDQLQPLLEGTDSSTPPLEEVPEETDE